MLLASCEQGRAKTCEALNLGVWTAIALGSRRYSIFIHKSTTKISALALILDFGGYVINIKYFLGR